MYSSLKLLSSYSASLEDGEVWNKGKLYQKKCNKVESLSQLHKLTYQRQEKGEHSLRVATEVSHCHQVMYNCFYVQSWPTVNISSQNLGKFCCQCQVFTVLTVCFDMYNVTAQSGSFIPPQCLYIAVTRHTWVSMSSFCHLWIFVIHLFVSMYVIQNTPFLYRNVIWYLILLFYYF